jgi:multiple sugar transport system permease protein
MIPVPNKRRRQEAAAALVFLLPNLLGFLVLTVIPIVGSFGLSFFDWKLLDTPSAAGLRNYADLIKDDLFWKALINTAYFVFAKVPVTVVLSLLLAVILNKKIHGVTFFRVVTFLPVVCSSVSVALIWQPLLDTSMGLVNRLIGLAGAAPVPWLTSIEWAMPSVVLVAVWKELGYFMVIFLAGLQTIPSVYYEAGKIDGASAFREFLHITVPLISPTTFFIVVTSIIASFQVFDITTVLTQGGPGNATNTLVMYIYQAGFKFFRMGYASAIAYMLFAIVFVFTLFQSRVSKYWVEQ